MNSNSIDSISNSNPSINPNPNLLSVTEDEKILDGEELAWHNLEIANKLKHYIMASMAISALFRLNSNLTPSELERTFREKEFNIYLIASKRLLPQKGGFLSRCQPNSAFKNEIRKNINPYLKYLLVISCRSYEDALEMDILPEWDSYEENLGNLDLAGFFIHGDIIENLEVDPDVELDKFNKGSSDFFMRINDNNIQLKIVEETYENILKKDLAKLGENSKDIQLQLIALNKNGGPVSAFTYKNKIISPIVSIVEYQGHEKVMKYGLINNSSSW